MAKTLSIIAHCKGEMLPITYTIIAAFKFAANLYQQGAYTGGIDIKIELNNVKGFGLKVKSDLNDFPSQHRKATESSYEKTWTMQSSSLGFTFDEQVFEAVIWFAECFCSEPLISAEAFRQRRKELLDS